MSEFQLYQFKSLDRPLTEAERKEIGSWSSRTRPTANSATFTYSQYVRRHALTKRFDGAGL